jgi:DNA-binding helix-hairpin-helix protein with protein kinase domain
MTNFLPMPGATVYDSSGALLRLDAEVGRGAEGSIWSVEGQPLVVAKFYHHGMAAEQVRKLEAMCRLKSESLLRVAAWPTAMLTGSRSGKTEGLLMHHFTGHQQVHLLYTPKSRRTSFPEAQFPFLLNTATNVARSFATVHDAGQVIGDVNHANLLVSNSATVALIDCDSFQITEQHSIFPCLVGVSTYQPPELQGQNARLIRRTQQHDAFGLAAMIFHLLFLGRHPFAGTYQRGTADMTIEQAISEFRFAYLFDQTATQMEPPPYSLRLSDFTQPIAQMFVRAFTRAGINAGRPSAHDWIGALVNLSTSIRQCSANNSHHFFDQLSSCPWCRVEGFIGIPIFGFKLSQARGEHFDISFIWGQIEAIRLPPDTASLPRSEIFRSGCTVDPLIATIMSQRTLVTRVLVRIGLANRSAPEQAFIAALKAALADYAAIMNEWVRLKDAPAEFLQTRKKLDAAKQEFDSLSSLRTRRTAELNAGIRLKQLQHFLEQHRIEDAVLTNIGPSRKSLLRSFNVEDASDVTAAKIGNIKGFGPKLLAVLLVWRSECERDFRFDSTLGIDQRDLRALEQELNQKRMDLIQSLTNGPQRLRQSLIPWQSQRSNTLSRLHNSAKQLAQAEVNVAALAGF